MAYQLEPANPVGREIARLARALLRDGTLAHASLKERVHHGRTTCKKVRALLRLLRERHSDFFRRENRRLRDAADGLATFRDAEALLATAKLLEPTDPATRTALRALKHRLNAHRQSVLADPKTVNEHLAAFARELHASLKTVKAWQPKERKFAVIAPEIEATYRRARQFGRRLATAAPGAAYHEWRKAVKAFGYHCRLARGAWPEVTKPYSREVDRLSELLGMEHDLTVLGEFVTKTEGAGKPTPSEQRLLGLINRRRLDLRRQAHAAAERLFAEKPRAYLARLQRWWECAATAV